MSGKLKGCKTITALAACATIVSGCSSKNSDSGGSLTGTSVSFSIPSSVSVMVAGGTSGSSLSNSRNSVDSKLSAKSVSTMAYNDAGTDYAKAAQHLDHVSHPVGEALATPKSIVCFLGLLGVDKMWDDSKLPRVYQVAVDDSTCDGNSGQPSQGAAAGGGSSAKELKMVTVRLSREAEGGYPRAEIWFDESNGPGDSPMQIRASVDVLQEPTATAKYGQFNLNFAMVETSSGSAFGNGSLRVRSTSAAPISFTFFEGMSAGGYTASKAASVEMQADGTGLKAAIETSETQGSTTSGGAWVVGSNSTSVKANNKNAGSSAASGVNDVDLAGGQCLSLENFNYRVHGYGLFRESDGSKVTLNTGVSCQYTDSSGASRNCHIGKHGAWFERESSGAEHVLSDGETVTRRAWGSDAANNGKTLTISVKSGKLNKFTVRKYTLNDIANTELRYFDHNAGTEYIVSYLTSPSPGFYKTHTMSWNQNGPPSKNEINHVALTVNAGEYLWLYSDMYGGVSYVGGNNFITAREEKVIMPGAEEFSSGGLALKCLNRCIDGEISSTDLQSWSGPYATDPAAVGDAIDYYFQESTLKLFKGANASGTEVKLASGASFTGAGSQHQWGLSSGPMVTAAVHSGLSTLWGIYDTEGQAYYEYRMGPQTWDKLILVSQDGANLTFDDPVVLDYTHSTANDRNSDSTFNGKKFLLRFQGEGHIDGFPWDAVDRDGDGDPDMWFPKVNLKDGVQLTSGSTNYRIKALHGDLTLTTTGADCSDISTLSLPTTSIPSSKAGDPSNLGTSRPDHGSCIYDKSADADAGCS